MIRSFAILIITCVSSLSMLKAQVQTAHMIGDTVFRYATVLENEILQFSRINLLYLDFPCVDQFKVIGSKQDGLDYILYKESYKEYYRRDATVLNLVGGYYPDPFLGSLNQEVSYTDPIAMVRSRRKDDLYEQSRNGFSFSYSMDELNKELREMMDDLRASELRVTGSLQTSQTYKRKDSFDNLREIIEGFVVETDMKYLVKKLEIRKAGSWQSIDRDTRQELMEYFGNLNKKYLSFYSYESLAEVARLEISPQPRFFYNTDRVMGRHLSCKYEGEAIYVYPNPTFGDLKLKFNRSKTGKYEFRISNIIGKRLWSSSLNIARSDQELALELPALSKGVYLYQIYDPQAKLIQSRRLILVEP